MTLAPLNRGLRLNGATCRLRYDLLTDFEPVALLASSPYLIVTKNAVPANTVTELIAWLKANHTRVSQGTLGLGGGQHLCGCAYGMFS